MMNSVAPFWDGNETWLVLGGGGLFVAFPLAYAVIMPALYLPIIIMLLGLIFRGVAFEFRWAAKPSHEFWDNAFAYGSIVATFMQGVVLGGYLQGINVAERRSSPAARSTGSRRSRCSPACALVVGYALLGTTWLVMKTEGELAGERAALGASTCCSPCSSSWSSSACGRRSPSIASPSAGSPGRTCSTCRRCRCSPPRPRSRAGMGSTTGREMMPFLSAVALFLLGFLGLGDLDRALSRAAVADVLGRRGRSRARRSSCWSACSSCCR